ncbi:unnamed protein product [Rhodiola kirilowii]
METLVSLALQLASFLIVGPGCECDGYKLCIVGHSLGGAIASLLGIRLYRRYPNLHVYAYGSLPCLDVSVADACSDFITTIVYDNEFSARLSVASILRLRGAALTALSQDPKTDTALVFKLARRFLYIGNYLGLQYRGGGCNFLPSSRGAGAWEAVSDQLAVQVRSENGSTSDPREVYLPGLIIHIVPQDRSFLAPLWNGLRYSEQPQSFQAYVADRKNFSDIDVSPSMFLDHLPWRCHYAMQSILETRRAGHCTPLRNYYNNNKKTPLTSLPLLPILQQRCAYKQSMSGSLGSSQEMCWVLKENMRLHAHIQEIGSVGDHYVFRLAISKNAYLGSAIRLKKDTIDPSKVSQLSWHPRALFTGDCLSDEECDHLIELARDKLEKSMVADSESGKIVESEVRTSSGMFLNNAQDEAVAAIEKRIAAWTFLPEENGENMQVLHYENGQKDEPHYDFFHDNINQQLGHRVATVLMYLSNVEKGGETVFPNALEKLSQPKDETVKPLKGDALLFFSLHLNATTDENSLHGSCPVIEGEKWSATKWIHVRSFDPPSLKSLRDCKDENENCDRWAVLGECTKNPLYMVGPEPEPDTAVGFCRKSCGVCS